MKTNLKGTNMPERELKKKEEKLELHDGLYPVIPIRNIVLFPHLIIPLVIGRVFSIPIPTFTGP